MDKSEMKCSQAFLVICLHPRRSIKVTLAIRLRKNRVWSVNLLQPVGNMAKRTKITNTVTEAHFCYFVISMSFSVLCHHAEIPGLPLVLWPLAASL